MQWEIVQDKNGFHIGEGSYPGTWKTCHYNADLFNKITVGMADCGLYGYAVSWGISTAGSGEPPQHSLDECRCAYRSEQEAIAAAVEDLKETLRRFEKRDNNTSTSRQVADIIEALDRFEQHFAPAVEQLSLF
jgi:hypothetical protein